MINTKKSISTLMKTLEAASHAFIAWSAVAAVIPISKIPVSAASMIAYHIIVRPRNA